MTDRRSRDQLKREFARRLQNILNDKGWNQSDLARAIWGTNPAGGARGRDSVSGYLAASSLPLPPQLRKICVALGVTENDLLPGGSLAVERAKPGPFKFTAMGDGTTWLEVEANLKMETALKIVALPQKELGG